MLANLKQYINKNNLFTETDKIIVAVSGGIDSVCLATLLHQCGYSIAIAHCNFRLRAAESDGDEAFVNELATKLNVPFHVIHFNTSEYAQLQNLSIQMAARELRYNWFENLRRNFNYKAIAIAHNSDDSIETFFINLFRGSGIQGLSGINLINGFIVRPLLFASRATITEWCNNHNIAFREDSSNKSDYYLRNKIRLNLLPLIDEMAPSFRQSMKKNLSHLSDTAAIFATYIANFITENIVIESNTIKVPIQKIIDQSFGTTLLFEILKEYGFSTATTEQIFDTLNHEAGKVFYSHTHRIIKDRVFLIITPISDNNFSDKFYIEQPSNSLQLPITIQFKLVEIKNFELIRQPHIASLDAHKVSFPLILRKWTQGDYFKPLGMNGFKKISDFFIDQKLNIKEKEDVWILASGEQIIWVVGHRIDDRFKVTSNTLEVLNIEYLV